MDWSFADFLFDTWAVIFPAIQWFVNFLISPCPQFLANFLLDISGLITFFSNLFSWAASIPGFTAVLFGLFSGIMTLLQTALNVFYSIVTSVPMFVILLCCVLTVGVVSAVLDLIHKMLEGLTEFGSFITGGLIAKK